jgi:hypothetical protein
VLAKHALDAEPIMIASPEGELPQLAVVEEDHHAEFVVATTVYGVRSRVPSYSVARYLRVQRTRSFPKIAWKRRVPRSVDLGPGL